MRDRLLKIWDGGLCGLLKFVGLVFVSGFLLFLGIALTAGGLGLLEQGQEMGTLWNRLFGVIFLGLGANVYAYWRSKP